MTIQVTTLANGLRVVSDSMDTVETVSTGVWVEVGARHETPDVNGVSHLLEHMVFKGTRRRNAVAIAEEIEAVGGHLNAYTTRENTAYFAKMLKEDLDLAVDVIADLVQNAVLDSEELTRERAVIIQEINQSHDTPDDIIFDHFQHTAFPDQGLGRPVLGSANLVVALAEDAFGALSAGDPGDAEAASYAGGDYREARDLEQVHVVLGFEGIPYRDDDFYPLSALSTLFGGGMSSRLFQEVREKRGLAYSIYSFLSCHMDTGLFGIYAGTGEDEVADLIPVVCAEIARLGDGVSDNEVARTRAQIKASVLMALESTSSRCEQLARQMTVFGRPIPIDETVARIEAVDADAIRRAAGRVLTGRPTLAALGQIKRLEEFDQIAGRLA
jgi:predicted Zn-dependent peptidase